MGEIANKHFELGGGYFELPSEGLGAVNCEADGAACVVCHITLLAPWDKFSSALKLSSTPHHTTPHKKPVLLRAH